MTRDDTDTIKQLEKVSQHYMPICSLVPNNNKNKYNLFGKMWLFNVSLKMYVAPPNIVLIRFRKQLVYTIWLVCYLGICYVLK